MNKFLKFHCLPFHMKLMFPEALVLSAYYRFMILKMPFQRIAENIGISGHETAHTHSADKIPEEVGKAVDIVCRHTPWESKCLVRALTARKMLTHRGYSCTLYLGVKMGDDKKMAAHAWLRCGDLYVIGGNGFGYAVTGIFGK